MAYGALPPMLATLDSLPEAARTMVVRSLIDNEANRHRYPSYQLLANFLNDRLLLQRGPEKAAEYWRYLAWMCTDSRYKARRLTEAAKHWTACDSVVINDGEAANETD
jgi:hypothetical protein